MSNPKNNGQKGKPSPTNTEQLAQPSAALSQLAEPSAAFSPTPSPEEENYRLETEAAMAGDLMTVAELAPPKVAAVVAPSKYAAVPGQENEEQIDGDSGANSDSDAMSTGQILKLISENKITPERGEQLLAAAAKPARPRVVMGDGKTPVTREELLDLVEQTYGNRIAGVTNDKAEMLEMMGTMVEKIIKGLREPSDEEKAAIARKNETRKQLLKEQFKMIEDQELIKEYCPHERATVDGKSHTLINAIHNYSDGIVRGLCSLCQKVIEPRTPEYRQVVMAHNLAMNAAQ